MQLKLVTYGRMDTNKLLAARLKSVAKWVFWIVGLAIVGYTCYFLYSVMSRPVAGILVFIGGILALYFYYVKWFVIPGRGQVWPPYQTLCPDYLTPISPGNAEGALKCVDLVGVSRNRRIKVATTGLLDQQMQKEEYTFSIDPKEPAESLRHRVQAYGLSWVSLFGEN